MSFSRLVPHSTRPTLNRKLCVFCQSCQIIPSVARCNGTATPQISFDWRGKAAKINISGRAYATQKLDVRRLRIDVDKRSRVGFYTLINKQGGLRMDAHKADSIYADFLAQKDRLDHGSNVRRLAKKYHVDIEDLTSLAIVTFKIPDLSNPEKRAMLPPSQHKTTSGLLLQGCAQAEDPLAIVQIMSAIYLSSSSSDIALKEIVRLFPRAEIVEYRKTLDKLCSRAKSIALGPDALTLQGLYLEREGQKQQAKASYQEAVLRSHLKFQPGARHPMQLPLIAPWNALGFLLKSDKDPSIQAQAKGYFEKGALEGDDPLSCYELAAFEPTSSTKWLQYTTKAAASGHREAMVDLANFYQGVGLKESPILEYGKMSKALNWLLGWRPGSTAVLAREWLQAASNIGHKPSMLQLADYHASIGDPEQAKEHLRQVLEPPNVANQVEEWPQLVQLAKKRLAGI